MTNVGTPTSYQSGLLVQGDGTLIDSALLFSQMAAAGGNGTVSVGAGTVSLAGTPTVLANQGAAAATTAPWPIYRVPRTVGTADTVAGAAGGTPALTYAAAGVGTAHILAGLYWSFSTAPTGGSITLQDGSGTTIFQVDVTAAGPGFLPFDPPIQGRTNTSLIVTGYPGGTAAVVKLNAEHWTG